MSSRYHVDSAWLEENKRPFVSMAVTRLCSDEHAGLRTSSKSHPNEEDLLQIFQECCSQKPEFITASQPLLESLFRMFLAGGNGPMSVRDIREQLRALRGEMVPEESTLELLLENDTFYGFRRLPEEEAA